MALLVVLPGVAEGQQSPIRAGFGGVHLGLTELSKDVHAFWKLEAGIHLDQFSMQVFVERNLEPFHWPSSASPDAYQLLAGGATGQYRHLISGGLHLQFGLALGYGSWNHQDPDQLPPDTAQRDGAPFLAPISGLDLQLGQWGEAVFAAQYRWYLGPSEPGLPPPSELSTFQLTLGLRAGLFR